MHATRCCAIPLSAEGLHSRRVQNVDGSRHWEIAGDRVLGIRFADTEAADDAWSKKTGMLALINTPGLAQLQVRFDGEAFRLRISLETAVLVEKC